MKNYRFTSKEIEQMKSFILTSINNETEKRTAWRARLVYSMQERCSATKKERAKGERMMALYESLTTNDLPNWNPIVPTEDGKYRLIVFTGNPNIYYGVKSDSETGFVYLVFDTMEDAQRANKIITPDHTIQFFLPYSDGVICDRTRPIRSVELKDNSIEELLYQMENRYCETGLTPQDFEFYLDGKLYEFNACIMHGYWHGRIDLKHALKEMRLNKAA